jgi:hypothetical protein
MDANEHTCWFNSFLHFNYRDMSFVWPAKFSSAALPQTLQTNSVKSVWVSFENTASFQLNYFCFNWHGPHRNLISYCCTFIHCCGDVFVCNCYLVTTVVYFLISRSLHSNGPPRYIINQSRNEEVYVTITPNRHVYYNSTKTRVSAHLFLGDTTRTLG